MARQAGQASSAEAGRYRIEAALGEGGMGAVYRAHDLRRGVKVALKRLRADPATRAYARRLALFRREFRTLSQLAHPRVIRVHDYGVDAEGPYYTMELLEGEDLSRSVPLPWRQAIVVLRDVASALAILHSRRLLHRDVTPRNVHLGQDGRAKLIDFGTMTHMGNAPWLVGTAPYVPPEAVAVQSLDARADLFALGALGYYLLTGETAYPARRMAALRDAWRDTPPAPTSVNPSVPLAFSQLVMQLMSLDRAARPGSAGEVVERLHVLAPDLAEEDEVVTRAYLATPSLVGRDGAMRRVQNRIVTAKAGSSASVLIQGPPGAGRSRFLDAAALEAKLNGAYVARADGSAARAGELGAMRALVAQLLELLPPELAVGCPAEVRQVASDRASLPPAPDAERASRRSRLHAALRRWLLELSSEHFVTLAVDDLHDVDTESCAMLAALSWDAYEQHLLILSTYDESARPPANMAALRNAATTVELSPLGEAQLEVLVRSLFGDVEGVPGLSQRLFELSRGNPREAMALAEHLVAREQVRYLAGRWVLPEQLDVSELPGGYAAGLRLRVEALSAPARELANALAICPRVGFSLEQCGLLVGDGDADHAVDELLDAQVVSGDGESCGLAHGGWIAPLLDGLPSGRRRVAHARLARVFEQRDESPYRLAHHLLLSGEESEGLDRLVEALSRVKTGHTLARGRGDPTRTLQLALDACQRLGRPARDRFHLQRDLTAAAAFFSVPGAGDHAREMLDVLERDSGLRTLLELPTELDPAERVGRALSLARQAHEARPPAERVLPPVEAVEALAAHVLVTLALGAATQDHGLIARVPSLEPLTPLSPALSLVERIAGSVRDLAGGRILRAREGALGALAQLGELGEDALDPLLSRHTRAGLVYALGHIEAGLGLPSAASHCDELDLDPVSRVNAWRTRMVYQLARGDAEAAERCRERAERLRLTGPPVEMFRGSELDVMLRTYVLCDDLVGIKRCSDAIAALAVDAHGWHLWLRLAEAQVALLRQDNECAFALFHTLEDDSTPGVDEVWPLAVEGRLRALIQLGWSWQARDDAEAALAKGRAAELDVLLGGLSRSLALAEAALGDHASAVARVDAVIEELSALEVSGVLMGRAQEDRARVAIFAGDAPAFARHASLAAGHYQHGKNPFLTARFQALLEDARRAKMPIPRGLGGEAISAEEVRAPGLVARAQRSLAAAPDAGRRASSALELIRKVALADLGYFYLLVDGELRLIAQHPGAPPEGLAEALLEFVQRETRDDVETVTAAPIDVDQVTGADAATIEIDELRFQPCIIRTPRLVGRLPVAVVALGGPTARDRTPPRELLEAIAVGLLEAGDVRG